MGFRIIPRLSKEWALSFEVYYQIKGGIPYTKANSTTDLFASILSEIRGKDLYDYAQNAK